MKKLESLKGEKFSKIENLNTIFGGTLNGEFPTSTSRSTKKYSHGVLISDGIFDGGNDNS